MKQLTLLKLAIKNFRSFSEENIEFQNSSGLVLLAGRNLTEPRLGANAAGKSSLFDALCWLLFGTSVRGAKTSSITTWGENQTEVTAEIEINNTTSIIKRSGPPVRMWINNQVTTQDQIDSLIGLSKDRFLHSVVFGQGVDLFPDLSIPSRGDLLDEVLSLDIWQKATEAAGVKYTSIEKELGEKRESRNFIEGKLAGLSSDKEITKKSKEWISDRDKRISFLQDQSKNWEYTQKKTVETLQEKEKEWHDALVNTLEEKLKTIESLEATLAPIQFETENEVVNPFSLQLSALRQQLETAEVCKEKHTKLLHEAEHELKSCTTAEKLWENDVCPVCTQPISEDKKKHEIACLKGLKSGIIKKKSEEESSLKKAKHAIESCKHELTELQAISIREDEKIKSKKREVEQIQKQVRLLEVEGNKLVHELETANPFTIQLSHIQSNPFVLQVQSLTEDVDPFAIQLTLVRKERSKLISEYATIEKDYKQTESQMLACEYWKHGFKRIRLYFVQQVLAALQVEIQSALSALGLEGWKVNLNTESETKSGTLKLGVQLTVSSPTQTATWEVWSGGELQRIRLACAMGLGSLIQRSAGCFWNLEVWDEPSKAMSGQGVEDLLEALRYRAESLQKIIIIADHSSLQFAGFNEVWTAVKDKSGSKIVKTLES